MDIESIATKKIQNIATVLLYHLSYFRIKMSVRLTSLGNLREQGIVFGYNIFYSIKHETDFRSFSGTRYSIFRV